jgi:ankyrin repeat protein
VSLSTYIDKLSSLFMDIGRSAPRHQAMALLYPRSIKLQSYLTEYFIVVVGLSRHLFKFGQKSTVQQFASSLSDSILKTFQTDLDKWANSIKEEMHLSEAQENSGFRALSRGMFKSASYQQKLATKIRVLDFCSTYDHQIAWKQIRKTGNTSFYTQYAEYQEWRDCSDPCTLMCTGKLGSGKSVLLANIVDDINLSAKNERPPVAYFFCRHDIPRSLQARTILGSLVRQLLCTVPDIAILSKSCKDTHTTGDTEKVIELLFQGFPSDLKAYFVLDGLDECDNMEKDIIVQAVQKMQAKIKVLVCVSFRVEPNNGLQSITNQLLATRVISVPDNNPDIEAFIEADLERCLRQDLLVIGDPALILDIQDALQKGSQGMFLWVVLQIQSLCSMKTDHAIREALADLPKSLSETFARILQKSGSSDRLLQAKTLQLVLAAHRPLTTDELREALSVTPGDAVWDPSRILNDVRLALACCGCLLAVDEEESTIRVVHHSIKQYILNGLDGVKYMRFSMEKAQRMLADIVVTYLGYGVFGTELSSLKVRPIMAQSAPSRIVQATMGSSSTTSHLALELLRSRRQPAFDMSKVIAEARSSFKSKPENAFKFYTYARTYWQDHVLYVSGQEDSILKLSTKLIRGPMSELRKMDKNYWTRIQWAAENGNEKILKLLLQIGKIDTNARDDDGDTLLMRAAWYGHKDIVKLLLSTGKVDPDAKNIKGQTPLIWAALDGQRDIVELLLSTGKVDPDAKDIEGQTPLMWAAQYGSSGIVELLLSTSKVNPNEKDNDGKTPLIWAAQNGHKDTVKLLLSTGKVEPDAKDNRGWTPLIWAARNRHGDTVELLLSTGKVDPDAKNIVGQTPLIWAALDGHRDIVELLLSIGKVNPNEKDNDGKTPLIWAAQNGYKHTVKLLLNTNEIDPDAKDNNERTALMWAAQHKHKDIIELLLSTNKINPDAKDDGGWTPLMWAAREGYNDIVKLLLSTNNVDPNVRNMGGRTPLMWATQRGHKDTVELLLNTDKVDPDAKDIEGQTPLISAAVYGHRDIVELLLSTGKVDLDVKDDGGQTPLILAAAYGHRDIVELLLSTGKVDLDVKDIEGHTPLMLAVQNRHKDTVELLQSYLDGS